MMMRARTITNRENVTEQIRLELGDELDRAKCQWMTNAIRTGEDGHVRGQWRELKVRQGLFDDT